MWRKLRPEFLPKTTPLNALLRQLITPISKMLLRIFLFLGKPRGMVSMAPHDVLYI
jgi:hypothetical protein